MGTILKVCQGEDVSSSVYIGEEIFHKDGADVRRTVEIVSVRTVGCVEVIVTRGEDRVTGEPFLTLYFIVKVSAQKVGYMGDRFTKIIIGRAGKLFCVKFHYGRLY